MTKGQLFATLAMFFNPSLSHCVIPFGFKKGKTEIFSYQFRAISSFLINLLVPWTKKNHLILLWTMVVGKVVCQAWQEFCRVWLELVCHKRLGQSGIWITFNRELWKPCGNFRSMLQGVFFSASPPHYGLYNSFTLS